jgi:hypothetical protein
MVPKIKFDALITIDDWSAALARILQAARAATEARDSTDRLALQDLLLAYIKRSPAKVELFDVIARGAIEDLALAEIGVSLERIAARSAELTRATALVAAAAAEASKDARALQLDGTRDALTKARAAIEALTRLERAADDPDLDLLQKLKASGDAIGIAVRAMGPTT